MKIVVVGAGEVGFHIASRLALEKKDVVVIDKNPEALRRIFESLDVQAVQGCGSNPKILEDVGVKAADLLLAVTNSDETNLTACLFAGILSPATMKLARIRGEEYLLYENALREAPYGIDVLINPEAEAVKTVVRLLQVPGALDVGEFAEGRIKVIGVRLDGTCSVNGTKLVDLRKKTGKKKILVVAIKREDRLIIPSGEDQLQEGDMIYFVSEEKELKAALKIFGKSAERFNRVLLVGGGNLGFKLAKALEGLSIHTKLIEKNPVRCRELAEQLDKVVVLHGDGSEQPRDDDGVGPERDEGPLVGGRRDVAGHSPSRWRDGS